MPRSIWGRRHGTVCPASGRRLWERRRECVAGIAFDRRLYVVRRVFEQSNVRYLRVPPFQPHHRIQGHVPGQGQLRQFYPDLQDRGLRDRHRPWSTPAFPPTPTPSWKRAHPNRFILHNGEINTIRGNVDTDAGPGGDHGVQPLSGRRYDQGACRWSIRAVPTPPCWITPWNSWS